MMNFKDKTIIVTGGTRGIGKAIAQMVVSRGGKVIITGTKEKVDDLPENFIYQHLDFLKDETIEKFIGYIDSLGRVDVLVNNAGINIIESIDELKTESWNKIMQVNLTGPMLLMRAVSRIMKKQKSGHILNISSIWGVIAKEKRGAYASSKTGIKGLTRAASLDLAPYNILVNALSPGFTMTELTQSTLSQQEIEELAEQVPMKRFADVGEMASVAVFLCSELNTYLTGQTIIVDGGFVIQ